jgi:hypothetical protein
MPRPGCGGIWRDDQLPGVDQRHRANFARDGRDGQSKDNYSNEPLDARFVPSQLLEEGAPQEEAADRAVY